MFPILRSLDFYYPCILQITGSQTTDSPWEPEKQSTKSRKKWAFCNLNVFLITGVLSGGCETCYGCHPHGLVSPHDWPSKLEIASTNQKSLPVVSARHSGTIEVYGMGCGSSMTQKHLPGAPKKALWHNREHYVTAQCTWSRNLQFKKHCIKPISLIILNAHQCV